MKINHLLIIILLVLPFTFATEIDLKKVYNAEIKDNANITAGGEEFRVDIIVQIGQG